MRIKDRDLFWVACNKTYSALDLTYASINGSLDSTLKGSLVFTFGLELLTQRFTSHSHYFV